MLVQILLTVNTLLCSLSMLASLFLLYSYRDLTLLKALQQGSVMHCMRLIHLANLYLMMKLACSLQPNSA